MLAVTVTIFGPPVAYVIVVDALLGLAIDPPVAIHVHPFAAGLLFAVADTVTTPFVPLFETEICTFVGAGGVTVTVTGSLAVSGVPTVFSTVSVMLYVPDERYANVALEVVAPLIWEAPTPVQA